MTLSCVTSTSWIVATSKGSRNENKYFRGPKVIVLKEVILVRGTFVAFDRLGHRSQELDQAHYTEGYTDNSIGSNQNPNS
jgi:hypothetical protein